MTKPVVYAPIPEFGELVEYITQDAPVERENDIYYGLVYHHIPIEQHALDSLIVLEAVKADYSKVDQIGRPPILSTTELEAAKAALPYHADVIEAEVTSTDPAQIINNLIEVRKRPDWYAGKAVAVGEVYFYGGNLYTVIQAHTTQSDWTPPVTPALWKRFYEVEAGPQPWVQPTGAHDAYNIGDRVTFEGRLYESKINANVWSPTAYPAGWTDLGAI